MPFGDLLLWWSSARRVVNCAAEGAEVVSMEMKSDRKKYVEEGEADVHFPQPCGAGTKPGMSEWIFVTEVYSPNNMLVP